MMQDEKSSNQILFQPKPFPVSMVPDGSLIRDYIEMVSPTTEAPPQYHFSTILVAIATVCKRNVNIPWAGGRPLYPNLYVVNIGESGLARKSTAQDFIYRLLNQVDSRYIFSGLTSIEAFCSDFIQFPYRVMVQDELRNFMENANKNYGRGLIPKITEMWSCPIDIRMNFMHIPLEKRVITKPTLNILSATTPDWFQLEEIDIAGGFLGRFLPICSLGENLKDIPRPKKLDMDKLNNIIERLKAISELKGEFSFAPDAGEVFDDVYVQNKKEFSELEDKTSIVSFWSRIPDHIIKLAMLFHIAINGNPDFVLNKEVISLSYSAMQHIKEYYKYFLSRLTFSKTHRIENKTIEKICQTREGYFRYSRLMQNSHLDKWHFEKLMETLVAKELIILGEVSTPTKPLRIVINPAKLSEVKGEFGKKLKY